MAPPTVKMQMPMPSAAGKRAIGRGLDALLADARISTADGKSGVMMLPVDQIRPVLFGPSYTPASVSGTLM